MPSLSSLKGRVLHVKLVDPFLKDDHTQDDFAKLKLIEVETSGDMGGKRIIHKTRPQ